MGIMSAWGTIVESMYNDARRAQELVYHSWYSYTIFVALAINLTAVMADRWPWKQKHIGFLCAHIGILILLAGSLLTRYFGIDGQMAVDINKKKNQILIPAQTDLVVYSSLGTGGYRNIYNQPVEFLKNPPTESKPHVIELPTEKIILDKFQPYSRGEVKVIPSDLPADGPALRFQIANERVRETEWIVLGSRPINNVTLGPARILLARKGVYKYSAGNVLLIEYEKGKEELEYSVFTDRLKKKTASGKIRAGGSIDTGWMGLTFRLLKYLPKAREEFRFMPMARSAKGVISSVRVEFQGQKYWLGLNSTIKLFTDTEVYYLGYVNRMIPLDFSIFLQRFDVGRYQGTRRAASYASQIQVVHKDLPGGKMGPITISMNEPLKYNGFTFYQASFSENQFGQPTTSVFSVNRDPGRPWKYLGSLLIVFGSIHLFYFKRRKKGRSA